MPPAPSQPQARSGRDAPGSPEIWIGSRWVGCFSGATVNGDLDMGYKGVFRNSAEFNKRVHLLWMGAGTAETRLMDSLKTLGELLTKGGIKHVIVTSPETAHEWHSWRHLNGFA